ncbi:MAG: hypothetical protein ACI9BW_003165 [Gammaproteobacteria bacterium]|jgi:hypothetical protein
MNTPKNTVSAKRLILLLALSFLAFTTQAGVIMDTPFSAAGGNSGSCEVVTSAVNDPSCSKNFFDFTPLVHGGTLNDNSTLSFTESILNATTFDWSNYTVTATIEHASNSNDNATVSVGAITFPVGGLVDASMTGTRRDISFQVLFDGTVDGARLTLTQTPFRARGNPIPEPGTLALVGLALGGLGVSRRKIRA